MNYEEALKYVKNLPNWGFERCGTSGILRLLKILGAPQEKLKIIHIAGTNGKGSVATFCAKSLEEAGFKTGLYISPYVVSFKERIQINGVYIKEQEIVNFVLKLKFFVEKLNEEGVYLTEFDFITALAIDYFFENGCEFVVLEVGMGGRLDSTNVMTKPLVSVITHIDYDHVKELGGKDGNILNIAKEKAGIIKKNGVLVCSNNQFENVLEFLKEEAFKKNASFIVSKKAENVEFFLDYNVFYYKGEIFKTKLIGPHQIENAMLSLTVLLKIGVELKYVKKGFEKAFIASRLEIVKKNPFVVLDGAHNENGVLALKKALNLYFKDKTKIGVFSVIKTKDYEKMLLEVKDVFRTIVLTKMQDKRAVGLNYLAKTAEKIGLNFVVKENFSSAVKLAESLAKKNGVVVFFGSLYFTSEIRKFFIS